MSNYRTVAIEKEGAVTTVVLNRPEKRNAMNPLMHREMIDVLDRGGAGSGSAGAGGDRRAAGLLLGHGPQGIFPRRR